MTHNSNSTKITKPTVKLGADGRTWPSFSEALAVWGRIALLSFGGPAGQIALMHRILVEEKRWLSDARFLHALNFCMLLPGPEAQQLATYIGWLMHRTWGGIIAGVLFVLPGAIVIMILSWIYALYGDVGFIAGLFFGLKAAVLAIVLQAVVRISKRALNNTVLMSVAAVSFVMIFFFAVPFPVIIILAGIIGYLGNRWGLPSFSTGSNHDSAGTKAITDADTLLGSEIPHHARAVNQWSIKISAILALLWLLPVGLLIVVLGADHVFSDIAVFFSQMAVVTFGGAYAVLAYVAQAAVDTHGWLQAGEMLDGLGMAETTPGPLIMVTQFVGFMGAFRDAGSLSPLQAGTLGGLLTTWVTFVPCFIWIFLGAPHIERLRDSRALSAALMSITSAVVGVILNLAIWFGLHVLFREMGTLNNYGLHVVVPKLGSIDIIALTCTVVILVAVFRYNVGTLALLVGAALAGLTLHSLGAV